MSGPGVERVNEFTDEFVFVTDLAPTILELVDIEDHSGIWNQNDVEQIVGSDFSSFLSNNSDQIHSADEPIGYELGGNSALFKGDYKLVINKMSQNETDWHLFNIKIDPGETKDLVNERPELLSGMMADYEAYAKENNVRDMPENYNRVRAIFRDGFN